MAQKAEDQYKQRQIELGRPVMPREALKRTADHGWAHVVCAVWTPEIRFGKAEALESVEGIPSIPATKKSEVCKVCRTTLGRCVPCHHCKAPLHVECARQAGYVLGFDITPVKGSRRDQANLVTINGETGTMTAAIWCKEHVPTKTIVHRISEVVDEEGTTALQLFVKKYKQADLTQTGAMRKASQVNIVSAFDAMPAAPPAATSNRRSSTIAATNAQKAAAAKAEESAKEAAAPSKPLGGPCAKCGIDVTPRWYPLSKEDSRAVMNGVAQNSVERKEPTAIATAAAMNDSNPNAEAVQCHKCLKKVREPKKEQLSAQEVFDRLPPVLPQPVSSPMVSAPVEPAPAVSAARMSAFAQDIFTPKVPRPRPAWETAEGFPPATDEDDAAPQLGADGYEYLPTWARDEYGKPRNGWLYERSRRAKCARQDALAQERLEQAERAEREARDARQPPPQQPVVNAPGSYQSPAGLPPYMGPPTTAHPPIPRFVGPVVGHSHNSPHLHRPSPAATGSPSMYYPRPSSPPYRAPVQYRPASPPRMHAPVPVLHQPPGHHPALSSYQQQQQQHSAYYSTTRLPPHHLTNGGPPPRPMEASYGRPPAFPHDQPYRAPYPNIMRDDYRDPREQRDARDMMAPRDARDAREVNGITQVNNVNIIVGTSGQPASTPIMGSAPHRTATQDHRVNGGASASPNLRNLLE